MGQYFCLYNISLYDAELTTTTSEKGLIYANSYENASSIVEKYYKKDGKKIQEITINILGEGFFPVDEEEYQKLIEKYQTSTM